MTFSLYYNIIKYIYLIKLGDTLKIYVIKNNRLIGFLDQTQDETIVFDYVKELSSQNYLHGIDDQHNESSILFSVFENLLPENKQLEKVKFNNAIKREIDILLFLDNIHGSFEFYTQEEYEKLGLKEDLEFIYTDVRDEILEENYTFPNILEYKLDIDENILYPEELTIGRATGLSGFQYKFSVIKDDDLETITHTETQSNYIMKPYSLYNGIYKKSSDPDESYIPYLLVNEHLFMSIARDFGFHVPYNAIIKNKDDYHFIIKRYDRYNLAKIDHHDVLTLLNQHSQRKYQIKVKEIAEMALTYLDEDELFELFSFFVFSVIISHGDLHAKNISFIFKTNNINEKEMQLAPYYDISTVGIYKGLSDRDIGMEIKNKKHNIKMEDFIWLASKFEIDEDRARKCVTDFSNQFINEFKNYILKLPQSIRSLPVQTNSVGYTDPLESIFLKYYKKRVAYINKYLLEVKTVVEDPWA